MAVCPVGHDSSTTDYCSTCGTPMSQVAPAVPASPAAPARRPPESTAAASVEPVETTQTCPVCSSVASLDAFFCETCGYDFLTGSLPRNAESDPAAEAGVEAEPQPEAPQPEVVEDQPEAAGNEPEVTGDEPAETPEPSVTGEGTPEATPDEAVPSATAERAPAVTPAEEAPAATTTKAEAGPTDAEAASAEPVSAEPAPAAPRVTTFDLDSGPGHGPIENALVVDSTPRATPAAPQSRAVPSDALSLGDAGRDLPNPDDLEPLNLPPRPASDYPPQPTRVPSQAPRPRVGPPPSQQPRPGFGPLIPPPAGPQQPQPPQRPTPQMRPQPPLPPQLSAQSRAAAARPASQPPPGPRVAGKQPAQPEPAPSPPRPAPSTGPVMPSATGPARWVAEVWIDPEWYRVQQPPEQLPSPGQPIITSLRKQSIVVGRTSASGRPDLDCVTDTGVSRRQAVLTTDGIRWFVEDLGSSNGTYVGQVDQPMPTQPIAGRVELGHHDRVYVGSWTRIVVRPALVQEADL